MKRKCLFFGEGWGLTHSPLKDKNCITQFFRVKVPFHPHSIPTARYTHFTSQGTKCSSTHTHTQHRGQCVHIVFIALPMLQSAVDTEHREIVCNHSIHGNPPNSGHRGTRKPFENPWNNHNRHRGTITFRVQCIHFCETRSPKRIT